VRSKRHHGDQKLALATALLQRHYIQRSTGEEWNKITIGRTPHGKPFHPNLHYNLSKAGGVVVLVGYTEAIGVDIIRKDRSQFKTADLIDLFSPRELIPPREEKWAVEDRHLIGWAFKEAYMKFIGKPEWDRITSFEFLETQVPGAGEISLDCSAYVEGVKQQCYTEIHNVNDTHFIAIYTATAPSSTDKEREKFRSLTLQEITPKNQEI